MRKKLVRGIIYLTVFLAVLIYAMDFLLNRTTLIHETFGFDPSFIFRPLVMLSVMLYIAAVFDLLLTGELAGVIINSAKIFAIALFLSLIIMNSAPKELQPLGFWLLIGIAVILFNRVAVAVSKAYSNNLFKVLSGSASLFAGGYVLSKAVYILSEAIHISFPNPISLAEKVFYAFAAVSALSLLGILKDSKNPYLSYVGKKFGETSGKVSTFLFVVLLLFYFSNLRPIIADQYSTYIVIIEWTSFCLASFILYRKVRSYVSKRLAEDLRLAKWTMHLQKIVHEKDKVQEASKIAERFVEDGLKGGVLVHLISTLVENGVSLHDIEAVVDELVYYEEPPSPKLTFRWIWESIQRENKARRIQVLTSTLDKAAKLLGVASHPQVSVEKLMEEAL